MAGWLDKYDDGGPVQENYNEYSLSAPEGFVGSGTFNKGRDYSPAWGGQFADGGKAPIIVHDKNDPRLNAYQDSLRLYNLSNKLMRKAIHSKDYTFPANPKLYEDYKLAYNSTGTYENNMSGREKIGMSAKDINNKIGIDFRKEVEKSLKTKNKPLGWTYGDIAVPVYKKPTQRVTYEPNPTPQSTIDWLEGNNYPQEVTPIEQPVQPASPYGVVIDPRTNYEYRTRNGQSEYPLFGQREMKDGGDLTFIKDPKLRNILEGYKPGFLQTTGDYRLPEGHMAGSIYPSTEVSRSIGGEDGEPAYLIPSFKYGAPLQDPIEEFNMTGQHLGGPFKTWQDAERYGELRHEYVEKGQPLPSPIATSNMAMGGSLPGAVGFMYARTNDPAPSNGPYAKKTKPSAENGTEMRFYQEGLDWKPKTISKDGSQLIKLDQLTNFTNYNTKQPGGWLDKYEG